MLFLATQLDQMANQIMNWLAIGPVPPKNYFMATMCDAISCCVTMCVPLPHTCSGCAVHHHHHSSGVCSLCGAFLLRLLLLLHSLCQQEEKVSFTAGIGGGGGGGGG